MRHRVILMLAPLLLAGAPLYGGRPQSRATVRALPDSVLVKTVKPHLKVLGLDVYRDGPDGPPTKLKKLPRASLVGLHTVLRLRLSEDDRGREWDLLVDGPEGITPVTLWFNDGRVSAAEGAPYAPPPDLTREAFAKAWPQVALAEVDATWTPQTLGTLHAALEALPEADRHVLDGLTLVRRRAPARSADVSMVWEPPGELDFDKHSSTVTRFIVEEAGPRIEIYDHATRDDRVAFIGPVDAPMPILADMLMSRLALATLHAHGEEAGPLEDFEEARNEANAPGPRFPNSSTATAYIESYVLWRLDRPALDRAMPGVGDWFDAGQHR